MQIIKLTEQNWEEVISIAKDILMNSGIIIYPTETTYGMGVDARNNEAVEKLLKYKEKREGKALSIAVSDREMAEKYVAINETAGNLYNSFLPGPVTVISKSKGKVAPFVESVTNTLGVRIPDYPFILRLINEYKGPITATSANPSGGRRPYKIEDILEQISDRQKNLIGLIIDAGELPHNNPSTVVDTTSGEIETLRLGDNRFDLDKIFKSKSEAETVALGIKLGEYLRHNRKKPTVIAIQGDLGAGKTHFAGGVAKGLGISDLVKSPTFALSNEFKIPNSDEKFFHIDTYRMNEETELESIGFHEMLLKSNVILIEWADRVIPILDKHKDAIDFIWLRFEHMDEYTREIHHSLGILED